VTTKRKTKKKVEWIYGDESNKWVTCLDCSYEYFIESHELNPSCHLCGSKEYEDSRKKEFIDFEELDDLL
jgi:Zn finger protein HypA/HybF involved in hydrogenase expression